MKLTKSLIIMTVVISLFLAMPTLASVGSSTGNLAYDNNAAGTGKLVYKARLTAAQETVPVIDSTARGSFIFRSTPAGVFVFGLKDRKLSGAPTGVPWMPVSASEGYVGASYLRASAEFDTTLESFDTDSDGWKLFGGFVVNK